MAIDGISNSAAQAAYQARSTPPAASPAVPDADSDFADTLGEAVGSIDETQQVADDALSQLASGQDVDLHGTMIALEEADIALRTMVSVRDKFIGAYEQMMNMSI